jgi:hypothetical protein
VDFVFSFDSLVHADESVMDAYLSQFPRILKDDGVIVIHHSNLGEYRGRYSRIRRIRRLEGLLVRLGMLESAHWRDISVDAKRVEALSEKHGLKCISQELITWVNKRTFIDCVSTIVKRDSTRVRPNRVLRNAAFADEARNLRQLAQLYDVSKK